MKEFRVIVSGFEPFGDNEHNLSGDLLPLVSHPEISFDTVLLPVTFGHAWESLRRHIEAFSPHLILSLGLAEDRRAITPEFVAINHAHARIPDNEGVQPLNEAINPAGPAAYFSRLPVYEMMAALSRQGFEANISYSAGTYVCNYLMYRTLCYLTLAADHTTRAGFVHLPGNGGLDPAQAAEAVGVMAAAIRDG